MTSRNDPDPIHSSWNQTQVTQRAFAVKTAPISLSKLVEAAQAQQPGSFDALIEATRARLFRFCFYLTSNREQAEDIYQETYLKAFHSLSKLEDANQFESWLLRIAKNLFIDRIRVARDTVHLPVEELELVLEGDFDPATVDTARQVHSVLASMSPNDRLILVLVDMEGNSYDEVAEVLGISMPAARSRLSRARQEFLKKHQKNFETK
jgi:RNA polymerase sigma-70 factor (ECF subfamily)